MIRFAPFLRHFILTVALFASPPAFADEASALRTALAFSAAGDWENAQNAATDAGAIGADIIAWQRLRAAQGMLGEFEAFLARRPDWPGLVLLKEKGEVAVARSDDPARVIAYFGPDQPATGLGAVRLVRALLDAGQNAAAETEAFRAWTDLNFSAAEEDSMLQMMGNSLSVAHEVRLDRILWAGGRVAEAKRMLPRVSAEWRALAMARLALQSEAADAPKLVDAVPKNLAADPGLAQARFVYRMRADRYDDATTLILQRSSTAASLGDPQAWADRRATLVRYLMRKGQVKDAYKVASMHQLTSGTDYADLEFLAGFIALRKLGDADTALKHFARLKKSVATPISLARADYWTGRALQDKGDADGAAAAYQSAARYQTAYYGLLAAEKLGLTLDPALVTVGVAGPGWKTADFAGSSVLAAARLLSAAGDRSLSKRFFLHLAESLDAAELEQLADLALRMNEPHIALVVAKAAAERGVILARSYYPVTDMVPDGLPVSRALALAISRRESEFDPAAQSPAGARGLMQVMPATAEIVAKTLGEDFTTARLTVDPPFNVRVGSTYLRELADQFGPAVALIASGYNAGPGRPKKWIAEFGDPRSAGVDVVDWVETIPFTETRTYVMRVAEGVVIYRAQLKGETGPVRITAELTGQ